MQIRHRPHLTAPIIGAALLALVLFVVWAAAPDALLVPLLLLGLVAEVIVYGILYVVQRRRHW